MTRAIDHATFTQAREDADLADILKPFVGARFNLERDKHGYVIPRSIFVDVSERGTCYRDARIDEVRRDGVKIVTLGGARVIDLWWDEITEIVIRGADGSRVLAFDRRAA